MNLLTYLLPFSFSGYLKSHGIKIWPLSLPDGMWGSVWACSIKHNDLGTLNNMSSLVEYLIDILPDADCSNGGTINMTAYGDSIFRPSLTILRKIINPEEDVQKLLNKRLNKCRISIEMLYGDLFNLFKLLSMKRKLKLLKDGRRVRKLIIVAFFCITIWLTPQSMNGWWRKRLHIFLHE